MKGKLVAVITVLLLLIGTFGMDFHTMPVEASSLDYDVYDVAVTAIEAPASAPICTTPVKINVTIMNLGFYMHPVTVTLARNDTSVGTATEILAPGQSKVVEFSMSTSALWPGVYILNASIPRYLIETNITNNWRTTTMNTTAVTDYDVAVTAIEAPASASVSRIPIKVNAIVHNFGAYNETVTVRLFRSFAPTGIANVTVATTTATLTPSESKVISFDMSTHCLKAGTYTLNATVDRIACETYVTNNWMATTIEILSPGDTDYDVAVTGVVAPASVPICKDPAKVNVTVQNNGIYNETVTVRLFANATSVATATATLTPSESKTINFNVTTSFLWPGTYILNATVDVIAVHETNVNNNFATTTMEAYAVAGYDVAVTGVVAPASVPRGTTAKVNVTVQNNGIYNETVTVTLFRSFAPTGIANVTVATTTANLTASETKIITFSFSTSTLWNGTYTLNATVDRIACETYVTNNWMATTMEVSYVNTDVAIVGITTVPDFAPNGTIVRIWVGVSNLGALTESVTARLYINETSVLNTTATLMPGETRYLPTDPYSWSTTSNVSGIYILKATVDRLIGEPSDLLGNNWMTKPFTLLQYLDHAVIGLTTNATWVQRGSIVEVKTIVANLDGLRTHTFDVTITYGKQRSDITVSDLGPNKYRILTLFWNTTTEDTCFNKIIANVTTPIEDNFVANNIRETAIAIVSYIPPPTAVRVQPHVTIRYVYADITINNLDAYWHLAGFDITLRYNTTVLDACSVELGKFAKDFNLTFRVFEDVNDAGGYVRVAYMWDFINILPPPPAPYGNGTLLTINFSIAQPGTSDLVLSSVELVAYPNPDKWCIPTPEISKSLTHGAATTLPPMLPYIADINSDGKIDIYDIVLACRAYNSRPGDPHWNPYADIVPEYGRINLYDVVTICANYNTTYIP